MKVQRLALLLILTLADTGGAEPLTKDPPSSIRVAGVQRKALEKFIKRRGYNVCYDDKAHAPLEPVYLRDLGASCGGRKLYALVLSDLRFMVEGKPEDCSGGHTGSGGTTTPVLTWNAASSRFDVLFEENLIDMAPKPLDAGKDCPSFEVSVHRRYLDGLEPSEHATQLEYRKDKKKYAVRIIQRSDRNPVRWMFTE
jgi:hypothetical protein